MSIKHQLKGFLDSRLLWNDTSLFDLPQLQVANDIEIISDHLNISIPSNEVLGKRIEYFFEYLVNQDKRYQLILKNLQIFKDKITIGELDFLLYDTQKHQTIHAELIYKFYLYDPHISNELNRWIGPNRKDSLLEKVTKLKEKQLPLLYHQETISALKKFNIDVKTCIQRVCFFGNLFIPLSFQNRVIPYTNPDCIIGFWIRATDFIPETYDHFLYYLPQKANWIVHPKNCTTWYTYGFISKQISAQLSNKRSVLLWIKKGEHSFSRCFVVWW